MTLSDSDLRALEPKDKRYRVSVGNSLFVEVYPYGKYFEWRNVLTSLLRVDVISSGEIAFKKECSIPIISKNIIFAKTL